MTPRDRYARQSVLTEVGAEGQARLGAQEYSPDSTLSSWSGRVAQKYALACGWGGVTASREPETPSLAGHFRHEAARDVGLAAADVLGASWTLLRTIPEGTRS